MKIDLYIVSLNLYNQGHLVGNWLQLPTTQKQINIFLKKLGLNNCNKTEKKYIVIDYKTNISNFNINEHTNINDLNKWLNNCNKII